MAQEEIRVRYAPSPTGHLHIGGARTALFNYLFARSQGGRFIIRFEDTDRARHVEDAEEKQLRGLKWLGIEWDESVDVGGPYAPYRQTERLDLYRPYLERLLRENKAYRCYCTEEELERERKEQEARGETPKYSGRCRNLTEDQIARLEAEGRRPAFRFRVPEHQTIIVDDAIRGRVEFDSDGIGDFIIVRPDGIPTYNFAVVLDDAMMKITHVIRGEEHLSNTPRQVLIYQALGLTPPKFAHISLILNQDRKKMSKRDETVIQFVEQYKELGYLPEAVLNFIALLGWSPGGEQEIFGRDELIAQFSLERVSKSPAVFDGGKLNWMSNHYIKKADPSRIAELALPHLQKAGYVPKDPDDAQKEWVYKLVALYQEQLNYAAEIVRLAELFFREEVRYDEDAKEVLAGEHVPVVLQSFLKQVESSPDFSVEAIQGMLKKVQSETGFKGKQLFMPVRAALTGQTHGRDLHQTIHLLGRDKVLQRLRALLS